MTVRTATPQPLRSQQVDHLLDKAGSLLTHSLDVREALVRLGDLLVPQFADWCNIALLDEEQDEWRLVLTRHADPSLAPIRERVETAFGEWKNTGSFTQRSLGRGDPLLVSDVTDDWVRHELIEPGMREVALAAQVRSVIYLPLELDGKLLGSLLLVVIDPQRARYQADDLPAARRLATFVAAALRNARTWRALQDELSERRRIARIVRAHTDTVRALAAGLGHDIGNLLQPLRLRLDSLGNMELPSMAVADLKAIGGVLAYFQRLTSGLRLLAGDPRAQLTSSDITSLPGWWNDVEALMKDALPPGVVLHFDLAPGAPPVRIPAAALTHVIFNLVQNAGQEMLGRSQSTVRVTVERLPRTKSVRFRVEDNGPGLDAETLRHCFDPFFSSVSSASSTRLGLPLVRALVERAGGQISARSKLGEGTSFTVAIPAAERRLRRRRPSALARVARITVDDPATFESVTSIVRGSGFYVDETDALLAGSVQVWITDAQSPPEELLEFVEDSPNRLVVVVNAPAAGPQHSRIHRLADLDEEPGLREILTSFLPAPSPLPTGPATRIPFTPR